MQPREGTSPAGVGGTGCTIAVGGEDRVATVLPAAHGFVVLTLAVVAGTVLGAAAVVADVVLTLAALAGTVLGAAAVVAGAGVAVAIETDEALGSGTRRKPRSRVVDPRTLR